MRYSVIVPVYNRPDEVRELLESLCGQQRSDFEVLLVEDGSSIPCEEVARQYEDRIQVAFKPHPRLLTELYAHPLWGKEKADAYYRCWAEGGNSQLVTGSYVDLFKTSDAMIHDSGSFSVEYHFTGKPVMFTTYDLNAALEGQNELGQESILAHYLGQSEDDIISFIENVVLGGYDARKEVRDTFLKTYLPASGNGTVAEAIYRDILDGLCLNH